MKDQKKYIECPACAKDINVKAFFCPYCGTNIGNKKEAEAGNFVRIKLKANDKVYHGDVYVTRLQNRVSDIMNDNRKFISLTNSYRESELSDIDIGYIAINKSSIEWVCINDEDVNRLQNIQNVTLRNKKL